VATGSILVYAYILIYYTKNRGFENEGFEVESFFRPPTTTFEGRQDDWINLLSGKELKKFYFFRILGAGTCAFGSMWTGWLVNTSQ